jgi:adenylate cyclase
VAPYDRAGLDRLPDIHRRMTEAVRPVVDQAMAIQAEAQALPPEIRQEFAELGTLADALPRETDRLFGPNGGIGAPADAKAAERKARHDMRNVVGVLYSHTELLAMEAAAACGPATLARLNALYASLRELLDQIPQIVALSLEAAAGGEAPRTAAPLPKPVERVARILVVDDLPSNRAFLARQLEGEGHRVATAPDGATALQMMRREEFDLALVDLVMPGLSGIDVIREIRKDDRLRRTGVIVVSAYDEDDAAIRSIEAGAEDYLAKPVNPVLLRARIDAQLAKKRLHDEERLSRMKLEAEKAKADALLLNILPPRIIERLGAGESVVADSFDQATVLFSDFVGFTEMAATAPPHRLVGDLNRIFSEFDGLALDLGVEKIKTLGDGYMAVCGLPDRRADHAEAMADMALGMFDILEKLNPTLLSPMKMRIGIHSGPVIAGIIGTHRIAYDLWGNTVNVASRQESFSEPGRIHISRQTADHLAAQFDLQSRGEIYVRGLGQVETFFLLRRKDPQILVERLRPKVAAGRQARLLIADDDGTTRRFLARALEREGWLTEAAGHGGEAWDVLQQRAYDLLITDCAMPEVDGFELAQRIRGGERIGGRRLPIIALTASTATEDIERCYGVGMDAYISKPVIWPELIACVRRLLG